MPEWEYRVEKIGYSDHPWSENVFPSKEIEKMIGEWGKEGWELVHVREIEGKWRSNPEMYPGGDPGRMTWDSGSTILYFKRPGRDLSPKKIIPVPRA